MCTPPKITCDVMRRQGCSAKRSLPDYPVAPHAIPRGACPHDGFVWRARFAGVIAGSDQYVERRGVMDWKLLGLFHVAHAAGEYVTRSAAGRVAGEAVRVPTALLPRFGVRWDAVTESHLTAQLSIDAIEFTLHLRIDDRIGAFTIPAKEPRGGSMAPTGGPTVSSSAATSPPSSRSQKH